MGALMSVCYALLTAVLVLLVGHIPASHAARAMPPREPQARSDELQQLRDRVEILEERLRSYTGLPEHVATLDGKLMTSTDLQYLVDASIRSSDRFRDLMTYVVSGLLLVFGAGGLGFFLRLRSLQERAKSRIGELYVATQIARAVGDLLRGDQIEKDEMKKVWWTSAYQKLSSAEEEGSNDPDWLNWRAYTLRRLKKFDEALDVARKAAKKASARSPQRARAQYNIACYSAMLADSPKKAPSQQESLREEALRALGQAVRAQPLLKAVAAGDTDFKSIMKDPKLKEEFTEIIHPEQIQGT